MRNKSQNTGCFFYFVEPSRYTSILGLSCRILRVVSISSLRIYQKKKKVKIEAQASVDLVMVPAFGEYRMERERIYTPPCIPPSKSLNQTQTTSDLPPSSSPSLCLPLTTAATLTHFPGTINLVSNPLHLTLPTRTSLPFLGPAKTTQLSTSVAPFQLT